MTDKTLTVTPELFEQMPSVAEMEALSAKDKLNILKAAKMGTWEDGWRPYCMKCSTLNRMDERPYGFQCMSCKNMIGFNLYRLKESPLNYA